DGQALADEGGPEVATVDRAGRHDALIAVAGLDGAAGAVGCELTGALSGAGCCSPSLRRTGPHIGPLAAARERLDLSGVDPGQTNAVALAVGRHAPPAISVAH